MIFGLVMDSYRGHNVFCIALNGETLIGLCVGTDGVAPVCFM